MLSEIGLVIKLVLVLLVMVALGYGAYEFHHHGYISGQAERTAYYLPAMKKADDALVAANEKVDQLNLAALAITNQVEKEHADDESALVARAVAAESGIAKLLRQRATAAAATCSGKLPGVSGSTDPPGSTGGGDGRDDVFAASVSGVGGACERDAGRLNEWIEWYHQQRANALNSRN